MKITEICIRRPVFTWVISLIILTLGGVFYTKLKVRDLPDVSEPELCVNAFYDGADAEYMEREVTNKIERKLKGLKNLKEIVSKTSEGSTEVFLIFDNSADIEVAQNDTRSALASIIHELPEKMQMPVVSKIVKGARHSMWISVYSENYDNASLTTIIWDQIVAVLERLSSVSVAEVIGGEYKSLNIDPIDLEMFKHRVSPIDLENAINNQHKSFPIGTLKTGAKNFELRIDTYLKSIKDFENIIIKSYENGSIIRLSDVAKVQLEVDDIYSIMRHNGHRSIFVGVKRQSNANDIELSKSVYLEIEKLRSTLPEGINIDVVYDGSVNIKESIGAVKSAIIEAIILVALIVLIFLRSIRLTIIPILTIPVSLIGTFAFMKIFNFSINFFTLLAMVLAIGLVVDDAIVMLENIVRHRNDFKTSKIQSAIKGSSEITFAVISMTLTLAAVFLPVGFIEGANGKMFTEFAWTLAFAIIISGVVALTLTPMMVSRMLPKIDSKENIIFVKLGLIIAKIESAYRYLLIAVLRKKVVFSIFVIGLLSSTYFGFKNVEKVEMPTEDYGILFVKYELPKGINLSQTEKSIVEAENIFAKYDEISHSLSWCSKDYCMTLLCLKDWKRRAKNCNKTLIELRDDLKSISSASFIVSNPGARGGKKSGTAINFVIKSLKDYEYIDDIASQIMKKIESREISIQVSKDFQKSEPVISIEIDKAKAFLYNTSLSSIGATVQYIIAGKKVTNLEFENHGFDVNIKYNKDKISNTAIFDTIFVKNDMSEMVPLSSLVNVKETCTNKYYSHRDCMRSIEITVYLNDHITIADAVSVIDEILEETINPVTTTTEYIGVVKNMNTATNDSSIVFIFALVFIFLILAAQFESFGDALMILLSVPFAVCGGVITLWAFNDTMNMYSYIGFITLIGLVTKNAIMIVEFANQIMSPSVKKREAIIEASTLRIRPILMTSIATILGAIPLVYAEGPGSGSRHSIGMVIAGGMIIGTLITIFIIPVLFDTFKLNKKDNHEL